MKNLVILGAGTGGTIVANGAAKRLPKDWSVTVIDPDVQHLYQPGLLFLPFGIYDESKLWRKRAQTLQKRVQWLQARIDSVDVDRKEVIAGSTRVPYDLLVVASGSRIRPDLTEGMLEGDWQKRAFDFYTFQGAKKLRQALSSFTEGRLVVNVVDMPIKCPVAPLEFLFLADAHFRNRGIRDRVDLVYATPLDSAFTKPACSRVLGSILDEHGIRLETEFNAGAVDSEKHVLRSWDEREISYDLLVTIPTHSGAAFIEASALGNDSGFVPTDKQTLLAKGHSDIFVIGDATDVPASKAGSVAHFEGEILLENLVQVARGESPSHSFDGHTNCSIETGDRKAILIDFNYDVEPLPGTYPLPVVGPMALLKESVINHIGKLAFRWLYWNILLPARPFPVSNRMSMAGKHALIPAPKPA
ncbi:MAG TPA: FAD-dependent oxidoreductase [Thermoanaerobaculia bacterium]|nr:FAD-dependent oxidoreductase [Thermoanaerobaculia bacterium]